jgi:hypothetical protein
MTRRLVLTLVAAAALALLVGGSDRARGQEALADGSFESGSLPEYETGALEQFGSWAVGTLADSTNTTPVVVTDPVLSGQYAAQLDTRTADRGRTIYQDVDIDSPCFRWTFNVYRGEGINWAELIAGWRVGGDASGPVSVVIFTDNRVEFRTWDLGATSPEPLSTGAWHEIVVEADAANLVQTFSIDGSVVAEVQAESAPFAPETIIMGDVAGNAQHGLYTYDDVSLQPTDCPGDGDEPAATGTGEATPVGGTPASELAGDQTPAAETDAEAASDDDDGSGFPWWLIVLMLIILALLILVLLYLRRRRSQQQEG